MPATLSVKFFLIPNVNLPWCNLRHFPLVLLFLIWRRGQPPLYYSLLSGSCREPHGLFFFRLHNPTPLMQFILQTLHQLCCPSLNHVLNVFLVCIFISFIDYLIAPQSSCVNIISFSILVPVSLIL